MRPAPDECNHRGKILDSSPRGNHAKGHGIRMECATSVIPMEMGNQKRARRNLRIPLDPRFRGNVGPNRGFVIRPPWVTRPWFRVMLLITAIVALSGCGSPESGTTDGEPEQSMAPNMQETAATAPEPEPKEPATEEPASALHATVKVVDLDGNPLPHMAPVVTRQPNAFDEPVATGVSTDGDGMGSIHFTATKPLYLRAWDPALNYFPNNYYEVLPGGNAIEETLTIQMVPAAGLEVQLFLPDGEPAANETVGVMLYHPTRGPWWPAETKTDGEGVARFAHLPAGEYTLRFKVESGPRLEHATTALPPGRAVNLGALTLR